MKIHARRCGGLAGHSQTYALDTARIDDGAALEALVRRLDFFTAHPVCAIGADLEQWEITVDDGKRCRTVTWREDGSRNDWQRLVECLRRSRPADTGNLSA